MLMSSVFLVLVFGLHGKVLVVERATRADSVRS